MKEVYEKVYLPLELKREKEEINYKFKKGDNVHISSSGGVFEKGYTPRYSEEIFVIAARLPTHPPRYRIKDLNGEAILGSYYEPEMILVRVDSDTVYVIERVVRQCTVNGKKQALIKWRHYSQKFNT